MVELRRLHGLFALSPPYIWLGREPFVARIEDFHGDDDGVIRDSSG